MHPQRGGARGRGGPRGRGMARGSRPGSTGWSSGGIARNAERTSKDFVGNRNARFAALFREFDDDDSGLISASELRVSLKKKFDLEIDHDNTMMLLQHCDENNDGELNLEEFSKIIELIMELKKEFNEADVDGSKAIDCEELQMLMKKMNVNLESNLVKELMNIFDDDESGEIEFQEFFNLILYVRELEYQHVKRYKQSRSGPSDFNWVTKLLGQTAADHILIENLTRIKNITFSNFMEEVILAFGRNKKTKNLPRVSKVRPPRKKAPKRNITVKKKQIESTKRRNSTQYTKSNPFVDNTFAASGASLGKLARHVTSWKRLHEIHPNPQLFVDGVEEGDVVQGALGNCWFLGALSVIACSSNEFIEDLFVTSNLEGGYFVCKFFKDGNWVEVEIDDRIPCGANGRPAFASCRDLDEFWVPIVEKAYAKVHGGYDTLQSGLLSYALKDLTGEPVESLHLEKEETLPCGKDKNSLWNLFRENIEESFIMGCSIVSPVAMAEETNAFNLLLNHAYGIIDCQEIQGHQLVRLRNPWGNFEWNGRWSDDSPEWTPELQQHFGNYEFDNDGTFFMCFEDFLQFFNSVHVLRLLSDDVGEIWEKYSFSGTWDKENAGGCLAFPTWVKNPQFRIFSAHPNTRVFVCLSQSDKRFHNRENTKLDSMGMTIIKGDNRTRQNLKKLNCTQQEQVKTSIFYSSRDVAVEFTLSEANKDFVIVPSFYSANITSTFSMIIYMQNPGTIQELQSGNAKSGIELAGSQNAPSNHLDSAWTKDSAGGCMNHATWITNPQFFISCTHACKVTITITQELQEYQPPVAIGAYIFDGSKLHGYRIGIPKTQFAAKINFINLASISATITVPDPSRIWMVMPCTFDAGVQRGFSVDVKASEGNATLQKAKNWNQGNLLGEWKLNYAGGSMQSRTWQQNPVFSLTISGDTPCTFSIGLFVPELLSTKIGFYIFEDTRKNKQPHLGGLRGNCPFVAAYSNIFKFVNLPPKRYLILPCTGKPKNYTSFFINVLDNPRCKLEGPF